MSLVFAALLVAVAQQQTDTTFAVRAGGRLSLDTHNGSVSVRVWDRREMRVQASAGERVRIRVRQTSTGVEVEPDVRNGFAHAVRLDITVPRDYAVAIDGLNITATIDGVHGAVAVDNVEGAVTIRNTVGDVAIESISGQVTVENVRGNVSIETTNQGMLLSNIRGNVELETNNGSIVMRGIDARLVEASTINGMIEFEGTIREDGRYYLGAHNGQITMSIPERASASVTVRTANGRIDSAFPITLQSTRENRVSFTVGSGGARVEIESHNGNVRLVRPRGR